MKTFFTILALSLLFPTSLLAADQQQLTNEAGQLLKSYVHLLKGEMLKSMKEGGPAAAISICQTRAASIAREMTANNDWHISRTSLKTRNPDNRPDPWEEKQLLVFEQQHRAGTPTGELVTNTIVQEHGARNFRFMKAIPTGKLCLVCHGEQITPEIGETLQEAYPEDQATGFQIGDLRGAFSLSKPLQ